MIILFIILIVIGVYFCRHGRCQHSRMSCGHVSALDILAECYARGEIDSEEFRARKRELTL